MNNSHVMGVRDHAILGAGFSANRVTGHQAVEEEA
jgi:hypothetical protein